MVFLNRIVIVSCVCASLYGSTFYLVYVLHEGPSLCLLLNCRNMMKVVCFFVGSFALDHNLLFVLYALRL